MLSEGSRVDYDESFDDRKGKPRAENVTGGIQGNDRGPPREAGICRDFQRGNCTRGPGCRFSHGCVIARDRASERSTAAIHSRSLSHLEFFSNRMNFPPRPAVAIDRSIDRLTPLPPPPLAPLLGFSDDRGGGGGYGGGGYGGGGRSNECFDFQKGRCTRGDSCRFSHGGGGGGGGGGYGGGYDRDRYDDRDRDRYDDRRGGDRYDSYDRYDRSYDRG